MIDKFKEKIIKEMFISNIRLQAKKYLDNMINSKIEFKYQYKLRTYEEKLDFVEMELINFLNIKK